MIHPSYLLLTEYVWLPKEDIIPNTMQKPEAQELEKKTKEINILYKKDHAKAMQIGILKKDETITKKTFK